MKPFAYVVLACAIAMPAAASDTKIETVDVEFDVEAIESRSAAAFWSDLEDDLENAIIEKVADRIADTGAEIEIDIDEFDMSESFQAALGADSLLKAEVNVRNRAEPTKNSFYELTVTVEDAGRFVHGGAGIEVLTVPTRQVYELLVETFAEGVVTRLR
ncbi:hypothetical protein [Ovoidimarina sediminis]|uniref:hypothetical protein n=1 Tax=Ovoidimarina sediminis TaxID=3079856 RepID=UPI00290F3C7D|nr:hypothetical protein [Rhodophyticola sp. MJ-SS7]MDU8944641.1 hypothetical protein [Rhodophyticola sp. MJ-SS7]